MAVVGFEWTPLNGTLSYTVGGNTYPYVRQADNIVRDSDTRYLASRTPTGTPVSFVASAQLPPGRMAIEYRWDFGDGEVGFGSSVQHTYKTDATQRQARLIVRDNKGQRYTRSKMLNLLATGASGTLMTSTTLTTSLLLRTSA